LLACLTLLCITQAVAREKELFYSRLGFSVIRTDRQRATRVFHKENPRTQCPEISRLLGRGAASLRVNLSIFDNEDYQ